jgi:hypothetical protein
MKRAIVLGGLAAALAGAQPAAAQATLGWDVPLFSSYVWRGLTLSGKPVIEPDLYLTVPLGKASLTAGGWTNIELGQYDGGTISEGGGQSGPDLTEFDWWGEVGVPVGIATVTGGVTGYIYPNNAGYTSASNTLEVYGKLALSAPFNPKVSVYYDVDKVKGFYVEGGISHGIPLGTKSLTIGALAGFSNDMQPSSDPSFNFADNGMTHVDLSASMGFSAGPLSITPVFHFVINNDDLTKAGNDGAINDTKVWGGVTLSWSKAFGGSAEKSE